MSPTTPSTNAAIQQLRAEIIAPVWQLSPQRIIGLRSAFARLNSFFAHRTHALALLKMATSVVDHLEHHDNQSNAVDFLKEAMAHIVSLYEDDEHDPHREKETASRAYKRFLRLNISLTKGGTQPPNPGRNAAELLDNLETLSKETSRLPHLLEQAGPLSPQELTRATALLGKISAAINIVWAHLPPTPK